MVVLETVKDEVEAVMCWLELVWFRSQKADSDHSGGLCRSPVWMYASLHPAMLGLGAWEPGGLGPLSATVPSLRIFHSLRFGVVCHIFWHSTPSRVSGNATLTPPPSGCDLGY